MTQLYVVYKKPILNIRAHRLKVNRWIKYTIITLVQRKQISDRADFKVRKVVRGKEGYYIVINKLISKKM